MRSRPRELVPIELLEATTEYVREHLGINVYQCRACGNHVVFEEEAGPIEAAIAAAQ